jgi:hypothetical protein
MSVSYTGRLIYGLLLEKSDCKVIKEPQVTEEQPRYDTVTGKVVSHKTVVVKAEQSVYKFGIYEAETFYDLLEMIVRKSGYELDYTTDSDYEYAILGLNAWDNTGDYTWDVPEDDGMSIKELQAKHEEVVEQLAEVGIHINEDKDELKLHFISNVG